jgi:putative flippase GtrA
LGAAQRVRAVRFTVFLVVGWFGFALQLSVLAFLTSVAHWPWLPATIVAVELAVVHNFLWHERVTWRDRHNGGFKRFARFNVATGITSIAGNVMLMAAFIGLLGLRPVAANVLAVATMSVVNFFVSDRWVFAIALVCLSATGVSAAQRSETIEAWNSHVAETETRVEATVSSPRSVDRELRAEGESIGVPSGDQRAGAARSSSRARTSIRWSAGFSIPHRAAAGRRRFVAYRARIRFAARLHPDGPPRHHHGDLRHRARWRSAAARRRWRRRAAWPRASTKSAVPIADSCGAELDWRYEQVDGGVRIDLESLTLSRDVPTLVRPIASPIVSRIARESMVRTLDALCRYLDPAAEPKPCPAALPGKASRCS